MAASEQSRGNMETSEQKATYAAFMAFTKWACLLHVAGLPFLVLWFCTSAGFLTAAVVGLVILVAGAMFLRSSAAHGH